MARIEESTAMLDLSRCFDVFCNCYPKTFYIYRVPQFESVVCSSILSETGCFVMFYVFLLSQFGFNRFYFLSFLT